MSFPFTLGTAFSALEALSEIPPQSVLFAIIKKNFSLGNHWNLFSLSCYHMPNTFSTSSIFIIYAKVKPPPPTPVPTKMSAWLGL